MINSKMYKLFSIIMLLVVIFNFTFVYADKPEKPGEVTVNNNKAIETVQKIWGTAKTIVQVLAVAAIVFAGVRYMYSSADGKADIKNQTVMLVLGAVLVFGAVEIASLIYDVADKTL